MECTDPAALDRVVDAVSQAFDGCAGRVVIGYSGGLDSSVLLWAAARVVPLDRLLAVHINHNAQTASEEWEQHCRETTATMGVPFVALSVVLPDTGNFEAAARQARLKCFAALLADGDVLLLAQHRRDQAETALLRLIQGRGIYGMPASRRLAAGRILRPLLDLSYEDIEQCGLAVGLHHVEDPSNLTGAFDRSWIRQFLLPPLRSRWPLVEDHVVRVATVADQAEAAGRWLAAQLPHPLPFNRLPQDRPMQVELIRWWLESHGLHSVPRSTLAPWLAGLGSSDSGGSAGTSVLALSGGSLFGYRDCLFVQLAPQPLPEMLPVVAGEPIDLGHGVFFLGQAARPATVVGDGVPGDQIVKRWQIRFRCGRQVLVFAGRRRRVSTLLQGSVLPWERSRYPLLFCDDELVAIPGIAIADTFENLLVRWQPRVPVFMPEGDMSAVG